MGLLKSEIHILISTLISVFKKKIQTILRGCQRTICFISLAHAQHRQNVFAQNRFSMFLSNLRVK